MFGSTTLDIVIGLILVFLLYSLLVTILGEIVATQLGIRQRMLRMAIERMLNDDDTPLQAMLNQSSQEVPEKFKRLNKFFLAQSKKFDNSFAGKFYNHPSMKYLSSGKKQGMLSTSQGKPSYINNDNFAETLIHILREVGTGDTDNLKLRSAFELISVALQKQKDYLESYNKTPPPVSLPTLDPVPLNVEYETFKHLNNLWLDAAQDTDTFKAKLKKWFDDTMDRVTGWYKRRMSLILFILGFLVAMCFNVNSVQIVRILSKDKEARNQLVSMAVGLANDSTRYNKEVLTNDTSLTNEVVSDAFTSIKKDIGDANSILALGWNFGKLKKDCTHKVCRTKLKDTVLTKLDATFAEIKTNSAAITHASDSLQKYIDSVQAIRLRFKYADSSWRGIDSAYLLANLFSRDSWEQKLETYKKELAKKYHSFDSIGALKCSSIQKITVSGDNFLVVNTEPYPPLQKVWYVISKSATSGQSLFGFLITALAISLGAPFWFDLLKKLVAIRGAGVKPEEKEEKKES